MRQSKRKHRQRKHCHVLADLRHSPPHRTCRRDPRRNHQCRHTPARRGRSACPCRCCTHRVAGRLVHGCAADHFSAKRLWEEDARELLRLPVVMHRSEVDLLALDPPGSTAVWFDRHPCPLPVDPWLGIWGVERRAEFSGLGPLATVSWPGFRLGARWNRLVEPVKNTEANGGNRRDMP